MTHLNEQQEIRNFVQHFFGNLKCTFREEGSILVIEGVPKEFEKFYGTQSPYRLTFDEQYAKEGIEYVNKTSFLLKTMNSFLDNRGQTTLLKLDFPLDFKEVIPAHFAVHNAEISSVSKKHQFCEILRFTFQTTFMYLNEKEVVLHSIYLENGSVIDFNVDKYKTVEGKKEDIIIEDVQKEYALAKVKLKELIQPKITTVSEDLKAQLEKELARISGHFSRQIQEIDDDLSKTKAGITETNAQLQKVTDKKKEEVLRAKLARLEEHLATNDFEGNRERLVKEKTFFEGDEAKKYGLNISNKLLNMTIIYYPLFLPSVFFTSKESAGRHLDMQYDPIKNEFLPVHCDSCKQEIKSIILCNSGHLTCNTCGSYCDLCRNIVCKSCTLKNCAQCRKSICKKCAIQCGHCAKFNCSSHMHKNHITHKEGCPSCVQMCSLCNKYTDRPHFKICSGCGRNACEKCVSPDFLRAGGKLFCSECRKKRVNGD